MESITNILNNYGILGVELLKSAIAPLSATGKTVNSIHYEVKSTGNNDRLIIYAREFITMLETGRGPRKASKSGGFEDSMLEYMQARGIGAGLNDKKRRQLARFLVLRINKEGDKTFKAGGREVYSKDLNKYIEALKTALVKDFQLTFRNNLKTALSGTINP